MGELLLMEYRLRIIRKGLRYCLCLILSYEYFDADDIQHLESRVY